MQQANVNKWAFAYAASIIRDAGMAESYDKEAGDATPAQLAKAEAAVLAVLDKKAGTPAT